MTLQQYTERMKARSQLLLSRGRVWNSHLELRIFSEFSLHTYHSIYYFLLREYIYVTARCSRYVSPQMTCSSLEFTVAQWLEHPPSVWKVVGSISILNSEFFSE